MNFFDKLGKKANATYKITADKTSKLAKEAKLKLKMSENKAKINEIYEEIGKKVYENHRVEEHVDIADMIKEDCKKIDEISAEIEEMLEEIRGLKDKKQCKNCHSEIDINVKFCPTCGAEQKVEEDKKIVETKNRNSEVNEDDGKETEKLIEIVENDEISKEAKEVEAKIEKIDETNKN